MRNGDISNIPAPSIIIDGASLFNKKLFRTIAKGKYLNKIIQISREVNITVFVDKKVLRLDTLEASPFPFSDYMEMSLREIVWYLRRHKKVIFADEDRSLLFSGTAYSLDINAKEIMKLSGLGL